MNIDINQLKQIIVSLRNTADENGIEYGRQVEDWMYSVEVDYQNHHKLDQDDWNVIESEVSEEEYKNHFLSFKNARERQYDLTITNPSQIKEREVE